MIKNLTSLLETAVVIGGLVAAPMVVLASIGSVAAAPIERSAIAMIHAAPDAGVHTAQLKF